MNKFIDDNLKKGFIHKSTSLQASPFFFVAKKDSQVLRPLSKISQVPDKAPAL